MKVKELRKALEAFNDDQQVVIESMFIGEPIYVGIGYIESNEIFQYSGLFCVIVPEERISY